MKNLISFILVFFLTNNYLLAQDFKISIPFSRIENLGTITSRPYNVYGFEIGLRDPIPMEVGIFYNNLGSRLSVFSDCTYSDNSCDSLSINNLFRFYVSYPLKLWKAKINRWQKVQVRLNLGVISNWNQTSEQDLLTFGIKPSLGVYYTVRQFEFGFSPLNYELHKVIKSSNSKEPRFISDIYFWGFKIGYKIPNR